MSPEELAREKIDALLTQCGWIIPNRSTINLSAGRVEKGFYVDKRDRLNRSKLPLRHIRHGRLTATPDQRILP